MGLELGASAHGSVGFADAQALHVEIPDLRAELTRLILRLMLKLL